MTTNVEKALEALKAHLDVENDSELARKLKVDKSTVSSWRSRGRVPVRYLDILEGGSHQFSLNPPTRWTQHEQLAFELALFKFARIAKDIAVSDDYRENLDFFALGAGGWFWKLMSECLDELVKFADASGHGIATAQAILLHDYLVGKLELEGTAERFRAMGFGG